MIYDGQVELIDIYFGYPIYKVLRGSSFRYSVGFNKTELDCLEQAINMAKSYSEGMWN